MLGSMRRELFRLTDEEGVAQNYERIDLLRHGPQSGLDLLWRTGFDQCNLDISLLSFGDESDEIRRMSHVGGIEQNGEARETRERLAHDFQMLRTEDSR